MESIDGKQRKRMSEQTIGAVVKVTGISRSTLLHAAQEGRIPARQSGRYWLIDVDHEKFKKWLVGYEQHPRVIGQKKAGRPAKSEVK